MSVGVLEIFSVIAIVGFPLGLSPRKCLALNTLGIIGFLSILLAGEYSPASEADKFWPFLIAINQYMYYDQA